MAGVLPALPVARTSPERIAQRPLGGCVGLVAHAEIVGMEDDDPFVRRPAEPRCPGLAIALRCGLRDDGVRLPKDRQ